MKAGKRDLRVDALLGMANVDVEAVREVDLSKVGVVFSEAGVRALCVCTELRRVNLSHCAVTDATCVALSESCRKLTHVSIEGADVSDEGVAALATLGLESLSLAGVVAVSDASLVSLGKCKDLEVLNLMWCAKITSAGLEALAAGAPHLRG